MPTLPQDIDYGRRPSLDSSRLDRPTGANAELAESVVVAANTFQAVLADKQSKENQLNYALARNEIQQLDIEERAKLAEDLDWASHDKRYSEGFATGREAIGQRYNLSSRDMQILDSEANLIHAQGRVQVASHSRVLETNEATGRYIEGKAKAKALIILADPGARNRIVLGQLDAIDAQVAAGFMSEAEGAIEREEMTQDFALASLLAMPAEERYRVIRDSLAYRRGYGTSLGEHSDSFIRASAATGLPAELIHAVASRESSLDPSAVNPGSGAAGIMQLRAGTARDVGVANRMDADQSIQGGARYLAKQFERFKDPEAALAAYNWGPKNVAKAMREHGEDWLSHAPEETRDYVAALAEVWVTGGAKEIVTDGTFDSGEGPLSADDIRTGMGTDSIADFLHADTAAKILEAAYKEDKTNKQRAASQDVVNRAWGLYPEDQAKRMKYIADHSNGTVQNLAEEDARQRNNDERNAKAQASEETYEEFSNQMENEGLRFKDIPAGVIEDMESRHVDALRTRSNMLSYDQQWPAVTQRTITADGGGMSLQEWNEMDNYGRGGKTDQNLDTAIYYNAFTERDWNALKIEQDILRKLEGTLITTGELTPRQMVNNALFAMQFKVKDDKDDAKLNGIRARLENELRQRILAVQNSSTPPMEIDEAAKNKILAEILTPYAFTDTDFFWFDSDYDLDEAVPTWLMTGKQREDAFIDLERANLQTMTVAGQELNVEQVLRKLGNDAIPRITNPTDHNLRRAAWAFLHDIGVDAAGTEAEVLRRLRGE